MSSLILYHPIEGDVNATETSVAIAKSKGKLCALRSCRFVIVRTLYFLLLYVAIESRLSLHPFWMLGIRG
jgi:hypothetical protein